MQVLALSLLKAILTNHNDGDNEGAQSWVVTMGCLW